MSLHLVLTELAADVVWSALNHAERAAYARVFPYSAYAAKTPSPKKTFNDSVHQHFSTGRKLSADHRKAISEGLKRWQAAHGRGKYTNRERNHAIRHVNKHLTNKAEHRAAMASHYKVRANEHKKRGNHETAARLHARSKAHAQKHKSVSGVIRHLPQPAAKKPRKNPNPVPKANREMQPFSMKV